MKTLNEKYNKIKPKVDISSTPMEIKTFIPTPGIDDYQRGFIERYFIRKINDTNSFIFEVNSSQLSKYSRNSLYVRTIIDWRLTGTKEQIQDSNEKSIGLGKKDISNLHLYLPNLLQFSHPTED